VLYAFYQHAQHQLLINNPTHDTLTHIQSIRGQVDTLVLLQMLSACVQSMCILVLVSTACSAWCMHVCCCSWSACIDQFMMVWWQ